MNPSSSNISEIEDSDFLHDPLNDLVGVNLADMAESTLDRLLAQTRAIRMSAHAVKGHLKEVSVKIAKKKAPTSNARKPIVNLDMFQ